MAQHLRVDPVACSGHGVCATMLPELISLHEWGFPLLSPRPVPVELSRAARAAVANCPALALRVRVT